MHKTYSQIKNISVFKLDCCGDCSEVIDAYSLYITYSGDEGDGCGFGASILKGHYGNCMGDGTGYGLWYGYGDSYYGNQLGNDYNLVKTTFPFEWADA